MTTTTASPTASPTASATRTTGRDALVLAAFRIVVSFLFSFHGLMGLGLFGGVDGAGAAAPVGSWPGWYAGVIELVGALLVLLGVAARPAAFVLSGVMAFAYFTVHQPEALLPVHNAGELAAVYSWVFLLLAVLGPGALTLPRALGARSTRGTD
ncbi:DoxX family protein [Umezawaea beigongshangensis]|uniref:DoxX family protein n=1 Tax=Umezawaea beigongshangensis TaxID=2780383 RepID=UPI0018F1ACCC|nr:DoxX family protein [Umezawaea beigongshangensis]